MPDLSMGQKIGNNIKENLGVVEKAIIEVIDLGLRGDAKKEGAPEVVKKGVGNSKISAANAAAGDALVNTEMLESSMVDMSMNAEAAKVSKLLSEGAMTKEQAKKHMKAMRDIFEMEAANNAEKYANSGRKYFTVQFNPSTLQLSGHGGGMVQRLSYDKEDKDHDGKEDASASYTRGTTTIIMSVSLLFDCCDNQAAFLDDKLTLNVTSVGKGLVKGVMSAAGAKKTSIQTEVEGFIAALRNPNTRVMTFNWGELCYTGVLRSVGVNYTMFNPNGEPVRATVDLSMVCADDDQWPNTLAVWQLRYARAFTKTETLVKAEQKVGSLFNI